MATFYIDEIRKKQPHGPYFLGGMCAGGSIAYEVATQLERANEVVKLVAILDGASPLAEKRRGRLTEARLRRLQSALQESGAASHGRFHHRFEQATIFVRKAASVLGWEISSRAERVSVKARFELLRNVLQRNKAWPRMVPSLSFRQIYDSAEKRWIPRPLVSSSSGARVRPGG